MRSSGSCLATAAVNIFTVQHEKFTADQLHSESFRPTSRQLAAHIAGHNFLAFLAFGSFIRLSLVQIFKWETRKAWQILLKAFLREFTSRDAVELHVLSHPFHGDDDFDKQAQARAGIPEFYLT